MPCYRPLDAYQCVDGAVVFTQGKGNKRYDISRSLSLACGQCVGCRLERSRQWATRCVHEKQMHEENCFLTLTYDDKHLPYGNTVVHRDFQLFMHRLRKHAAREKRAGLGDCETVPESELQTTKPVLTNTKKLRFYMCAEYGEQTKRAHYHALIFGYDFQDKQHWKNTATGERLYISKKLNKLWGKGHTTIGEVTFETAAYVARYIMKKITGQAAANHYEKIDESTGEIIKRQPEYNKMSLRPGIGANWLKKWATDVYPKGKVVVRGHQNKAPKYYDKKYKKMDPLGYEDLLFEREKANNPSDNTKERLTAREAVTKAKITLLKRQSI